MVIKIKIMYALFVLIAVILTCQLFGIVSDDEIRQAASGRGQYVISGVSEYASIYDCHGERLVNEKYENFAVVDPNSRESLKILKYAADKDAYRNGMNGNLPFLCRVTEENISDDITVIKKYNRNSDNQLAVHVVGYTSDDKGVCGLEYSYDDFLRGCFTENYIRFSVDAVGKVLEGLNSEIKKAEPLEAGVITTLDKDIQQICEDVMSSYYGVKGAVVVMDVKSGEIRACASYPELKLDRLEESLESSDAPFVNRAFSAYSVGSIFKLCTAAAALESGIISDFSYTCTGSINVNGQIFNCHKWGGHGEIDMYQAMELSCNPYFIALSEYINSSVFVETAESFGFGQETLFADGLVSASGYLPTASELSVPAEKGNMSFGQGKLSATPVQICRMTAAIANNGMCPQPKLVYGLKYADGSVEKTDYSVNKRAVSYLTAQKLKEFMLNVVDAENSYSKSDIVLSAGKTSTAQTGVISDSGRESLNCWFTGYFPADAPKYAVTVLVEDGISGNITSSPIYKEIAERITSYEKRYPAFY